MAHDLHPDGPYTPKAGAVPDPESVLPATALSDLDELDTAELRRLRAQCEAAEEGVSYARRLLQGRLDILRAELEHRDDGESGSVLDGLAAILADAQSSTVPGQSRSVRLRVPDDADAHAQLIDDAAGVSTVHGVEGHEPEVLEAVAERLGEHERWLSQLRRAWFERIDALRAELAARYKDGRANVSELLEK